jgi:excisionase family DNA binding protein
MIKDHEEVLWDTVVLLKQQDYLENAKAVFKSLVERTFTLLKQPTDFLEDSNLEVPSFDQYDTFRGLDRQIRICLKNNQIERANELLIDYIELLSQIIPNVDAKIMQKQILAQLLTNRFKTVDNPANRMFTVEKHDTFTTTEAAEILNVSDQTMRRWCEKGKFPEAYQTDGGHWRIPRKYFKVDLEQAKKRNDFSKKLDEINNLAGEADESEYL